MAVARTESARAWTARFLASGLFLALIPAKLAGRFFKNRRGWTGAGLVGTVWGLVLLPIVPEAPAAFGAFFLAATAAAIAISAEAERAFGKKDDPRIVVDETVGFWAAAAFLPRTWPWLIAAFILFRFFDAMKFAPFSWFERLPGGLGVVMDDVAAGIGANLILQACFRFY